MTDVPRSQLATWEHCLLGSAAEATTDAVVVTTAELNAPGPEIIYVNPAFCSMTGYSRDELVGQSIRMLYDQKPDPAFFQDLRKTIQSGRSYRGATLKHHKDGTPYLCEVSITPVHDKVADCMRLVSIQRRVEDAWGQDRYLETVFHAAPVGLILVRGDGRIDRVNETAEELFGYSAGELVGREVELLVPDEARAHHRDYRTAYSHQPRARQMGAGRDLEGQRKDGSRFPVEIGLAPLETVERAAVLVSVIDIAERKRQEAEIEFLAFNDPLTGLANRRLCMDRITEAIEGLTDSGQFGALVVIDPDRFQALNDTRGHSRGDQLLCDMAERLTAFAGPGRLVARVGADEFAVLLDDLGQASDAIRYAERFAQQARDILGAPYSWKQGGYYATVSSGITLLHPEDDTVEDALKRVDLALQDAKREGRNRISVFDPVLQRSAEERARIEHQMPAALANEEFVPYYQPCVDAAGRCVGAEALIRWQHPTHGLISPGSFIPVAEESGLIHAIGESMLRQVCEQVARWALDESLSRLEVSVNVSPKQFRDPDFVHSVKSILDETRVNPHQLCLEVTESLLFDDADEAIARIAALRRMGISFALDDFGTGYSSMAYLKRLPLDLLKIDQSFVREMPADSDATAIVETIIALADNLGLTCIAEGVETEEAWRFLREAECQRFQGYLFSPAIPAEQFERQVAR